MVSDVKSYLGSQGQKRGGLDVEFREPRDIFQNQPHRGKSKDLDLLAKMKNMA